MKRVVVIGGLLALLLLSGCSGEINYVTPYPASYAIETADSIYIGTVTELDIPPVDTRSSGETQSSDDNMLRITATVEEVLQGDVAVNTTVTTWTPSRYAAWVNKGERYLLFAYPSDTHVVIDLNPYWAIKVSDDGLLDNPDLTQLKEKYFNPHHHPSTLVEMRELIQRFHSNTVADITVYSQTTGISFTG